MNGRATAGIKERFGDNSPHTRIMRFFFQNYLAQLGLNGNISSKDFSRKGDP